jgi:uncharacterized membrane protein
MLRHATLAGKAILIVCMAAAPLMIHAAIVTNRWTVLVVAIPFAQLLIIGGALVARRPIWVKGLSIAAAVLGLALIWAYAPRENFAAAPGIPHALAYATLLYCFGWSLLPGREAALTRAAIYIRGPLPHELYLYTRRVTRAWCIFFAAQLVGSAVLFIWAPLEVWSFFVNVLNLPLVLVMFGGEYAYRLVRFPDYRHDSFSDMMRMFTKAGKNAVGQADSA